ncbi:MAG: DNA-processing protein DprA [Candidatus Yanofskybacteria bacterium]|nr:DNA-processing protein DprA [Candidatus Yanofskybacteria bacterium]
MDAYPIQLLPETDPHYPALLKEITAPPPLYCRGDITLLTSPCFAVVGTRQITSYGQEATQHIVRELVRSGLTIVSGLAFGIDSVAHQTTLECGGKTIAVLGSAIDDAGISPRTQLTLARKILAQGGLIISEYPVGSQVHKGTFPTRNRIVSGLSRGVLVVEANEKSGALITAQWALEQNRDVFAVPGSIFWPRSVGPNALIKKGAKPVLNAQDILEEYPDFQPQMQAHLLPELNPLEQQIITALQEKGPSFIDTIMHQVNAEASAVIATVSILEIKGLVKHTGNQTYQLASQS